MKWAAVVFEKVLFFPIHSLKKSADNAGNFKNEAVPIVVQGLLYVGLCIFFLISLSFFVFLLFVFFLFFYKIGVKCELQTSWWVWGSQPLT